MVLNVKFIQLFIIIQRHYAHRVQVHLTCGLNHTQLTRRQTAAHQYAFQAPAMDPPVNQGRITGVRSPRPSIYRTKCISPCGCLAGHRKRRLVTGGGLGVFPQSPLGAARSVGVQKCGACAGFLLGRISKEPGNQAWLFRSPKRNRTSI